MENSKLSIIEKIKTFYYYLFYTLYKWYENSYFNWWSEWKAGISLDIIIFFALFPLFLYYNIYVDRNLRIENYIIHIKSIFIIFIIIPNIIIFNRNNRWRKIISRFEGISAKEDKFLTRFSWIIILLIISHFIFVLYLMFQIKWQ